MATIEEISALLDKKLEELREQITIDIEKKFKEKIDENARIIAGNVATIKGHAQELQTLKEQHRLKIEELETERKRQNEELDDQINRSMRGNIVVRGLPEDNKEDWSTTKSKLCDFLATLSTETPQVIYQKLDRAHRSGKREEGKPRNIYANFVKSVDANYYVDQFVKLSVKRSRSSLHNNNSKPIRVDHQYTKQLEERRNQAKIERRKLLDAKEIAMGHIAYPAKLLVKADANDKKWNLIREF